MTRGILVHKVQKGEKGNDGVPGAKGEQGPKGDTPDISNLVTKTQYTNDLNKKIDKTAFNAVGQHISYNGITIHIQRSNTIITCNVEGIFKKEKPMVGMVWIPIFKLAIDLKI